MKAMLTRPFRIAGIAMVLAVAVAPAAPAQSETFVPGYTDFPNHLRVHSIFDEARMQGGAGAPGTSAPGGAG